MNGTAHVKAGICGHETTLHAETSDGRMVSLAVETTCDNIERLKARLDAQGALDAYGEINPRAASTMVALAREAAICTDCIVPLAALKAMRVAAGLALPADAAIVIQKD